MLESLLTHAGELSKISSPRLQRLLQSLGHLPVAKAFSEIIRQIIASDVTVLVGEMGTGKTLFVGPALAAMGAQVLCTEPRRLAAHAPAVYLSNLLGERLHDFIGVRTSIDHTTRDDCPLIFATDGLALVRAVLGHGATRDVMIIDEAHEMNLNMEVLLAWTRLQKTRGLPTKLVVMSGTMDADRIAEYYRSVGLKVGISKVFGAQFGYVMQAPGISLADDVKSLLGKGRSVIVFLPGVKEIHSAKRELEAAGTKAKIFQLHGGLTPEEQRMAFEVSSEPKVVLSTNISESSLTVPGISAVIDFGLKNQLRMLNGIEMLETVWVSKAEQRQRWARSCRERDGVVINRMPPTHEALLDYPEPEIQRVDLSRAYLQFSQINIAMEQFTYVNPPSQQLLTESRRKLVELGLLTENGQITNNGLEALRIPAEVECAVMLSEAARLGILKQMISVVAIIHAGGIINRKRHRESGGGSAEFILLDELSIFNQLIGSRSPANRSHTIGLVDRTNFEEACRIRSELLRRLGGSSLGQEAINAEALTQCIAAGFIRHLHRRISGFIYIGSDGQHRLINREDPEKNAELMVGLPNSRSSVSGNSRHSVHSVRFATPVSAELIIKLAPHLVKSSSEVVYNVATDAVVRRVTSQLGAVVVRDSVEPLAMSDSSEVQAAIAKWLVRETSLPKQSRDPRTPEAVAKIIETNALTIASYNELNAKLGRLEFQVPSQSAQIDHATVALGRSRSFCGLKDLSALLIPPPALSPELMQSIKSKAPDTLNFNGVELPVLYYVPSTPMLVISEEQILNGALLRLGDARLKTPDGRNLTIHMIFRRTNCSLASIGEVKRAVLKYTVKEEFQVFSKQRAEISQFSATDDKFKTLQVATVTCRLTGEALRFYGAWVPANPNAGDVLENMHLKFFETKGQAEAVRVETCRRIKVHQQSVRASAGNNQLERYLKQLGNGSSNLLKSMSRFDIELAVSRLLGPDNVVDVEIEGERAALAVTVRPGKTREDLCRLQNVIEVKFGCSVQIRESRHFGVSDKVFLPGSNNTAGAADARSLAELFWKDLPPDFRIRRLEVRGDGYRVYVSNPELSNTDIEKLGARLAKKSSLPVIVRQDPWHPKFRKTIVDPIVEYFDSHGISAPDVVVTPSGAQIHVPIDICRSSDLSSFKEGLAGNFPGQLELLVDTRQFRVHQLFLELRGQLPYVDVQYVNDRDSPLIVYLSGNASEEHSAVASLIERRLGIGIKFIENQPETRSYELIAGGGRTDGPLCRGTLIESQVLMALALPEVYGVGSQISIFADSIIVTLPKGRALDDRLRGLILETAKLAPVPTKVRSA